MQAVICKFLWTAFRAYPLFSGGGTLANSKLPTWASVPLGDRAIATLRSGAHLVVNPQECLGRSVYYTGEWDPKITWVLNRLLRAGDTFIDIGAHCGVTAVAAAQRVGPFGLVHAFEPQPDLAAMLKESASINGLLNVHIHNVALSAEAGKMDLFITENKQILATLEKSGGNYHSIKVRVENASDCLRKLRLEKVRLIKIDVEGHEIKVLRGARNFLSVTPPDAILFESVPAEGPFWERPAVTLLSSMGYRFISIPKQLLRMHTNVVAAGISPDSSCHDFVAASDALFNQVADALSASR
jgi:FkbM family methyltransferase